MIIDNVAVLTSKESWFFQYAKILVESMQKAGYTTDLIFSHTDIQKNYDVVFMLSYFSIVPERYLTKSKINLVVHESDLPQGKGWAPLFWQILEDKNEIPIVLFEALPGVDSGDIYIKDTLSLLGNELNEEIRQKQAEKTFELCLRFLHNSKSISPKPQMGSESFYPKRTPRDSELDPQKSIAEQFDLMRLANNEEYPAFFRFRGKKYILKVFEGELDD